MNKFLWNCAVGPTAPTGVMAEAVVPVKPPEIMIDPGGFPATKERLDGKGPSSGAKRKKDAPRKNPAVNVLITWDEKIWVSCKLATWLRRVSAGPNSGSGAGLKL